MGFLSLILPRRRVPQTQEKCWSNIPSDILNIIRSKLQTRERVRLAATCRMYRNISIIDHVPPALSLSPCLLYSGDYRFHHPVCSTTTKVNFEASDSCIRDFNFGWFLMTRPSMTESVTQVLFYNPATSVQISVPTLTDVRYEWTLRFTAPPTSMDCQIVGIAPLGYYPEVTVGVRTIGRNEKNWTVIHESRLPRFFTRLASCKPMLFEGAYYCLESRGSVMKFDPTVNECRYKKCSTKTRGGTKDIPQNPSGRKVIPKLFRKPNTRRYLVETDGELLGVFVNHEGGSVGVFRLNTDTMEFDERVFNVGNKMLYVSYEKCYSETAAVEGTGNKIYLPQFHEQDSLFYSLDTNKFHTYTGHCTDKLYNEKSFERSVWIKPVFDTKCTQAFEW